jgi:hypothetical protein
LVSKKKRRGNYKLEKTIFWQAFKNEKPVQFNTVPRLCRFQLFGAKMLLSSKRETVKRIHELPLDSKQCF